MRFYRNWPSALQPMSAASLRPTSAHIWGAKDGCRGYLNMIAQVPSQPSTYADEGIAAHKLVAKMIVGLSHGGVIKGHRRANIDPTITDEMFDAAELYANDVLVVMRDTKVFGGNNIGTETEIDLSSISPGMKGVVDQWLYDKKNHTLYIWDFKYGHGLIEVWENLQLVLYAWGLLADYNTGAPMDHPDLTIDIRIVQPRGFHPEGPIRSWVTNYDTISEHGNQLIRAASEATHPTAQTHSGSHCRYCRARYVCSSAQSAGLLAAEYSREAVPAEMDSTALGTYLTTAHRAAEALGHIITGLEAQAKTVIRRGHNVPGFSLAPSPGNLNWDVPDDTIRILATMLKKELIVTKPITPTQSIAVGVPKDIVFRYASRPNRGSKLIPDKGEQARRIFSNQPKLKELLS